MKRDDAVNQPFERTNLTLDMKTSCALETAPWESSGPITEGMPHYQ